MTPEIFEDFLGCRADGLRPLSLDQVVNLTDGCIFVFKEALVDVGDLELAHPHLFDQVKHPTQLIQLVLCVGVLALCNLVIHPKFFFLQEQVFNFFFSVLSLVVVPL